MNFLTRLFKRDSSERKSLRPTMPYGRAGQWFSLGNTIREPFAGAWQRNKSLSPDTPLANSAIFSCTTLIASDVSKLRVKLVEKNTFGIWEEYDDPNISEVLSEPNNFQTRNQFFESWVLSKLRFGNTYVLKIRDRNKKITGLRVLDAGLVIPLVSDAGAVFYQLNADNLSGIQDGITVPASEIIHDRYNCLFHPLVGLSPLFSAALVGSQAQYIIGNSTEFFSKGSSSPGILTAPGAISDKTADRLQEYWEKNYTGSNIGKVAVVGDGLRFEPMSVSAVDSQLIEQLQWSARTIAGIYHVPPYKIGVEMPPNYSIDVLALDYYQQCLQRYLEDIESCLDKGFGLNSDIQGTEFDVDGLVRMDQSAMVDAESSAVKSGIKSINEARKRFDLRPLPGGDTPYLQEQNYPLEALAQRDMQGNLVSEQKDKEHEKSISDDALRQAVKSIIDENKTKTESSITELQKSLAAGLGLKSYPFA